MLNDNLNVKCWTKKGPCVYVHDNVDEMIIASKQNITHVKNGTVIESIPKESIDYVMFRVLESLNDDAFNNVSAYCDGDVVCVAVDGNLILTIKTAVQYPEGFVLRFSCTKEDGPDVVDSVEQLYEIKYGDNRKLEKALYKSIIQYYKFKESPIYVEHMPFQNR